MPSSAQPASPADHLSGKGKDMPPGDCTAGNSPNTIMAAAAAIIGPNRVERAIGCTRALIDLFAHTGLLDPRDETFDLRGVRVDEKTRSLFLATDARDPSS